MNGNSRIPLGATLDSARGVHFRLWSEKAKRASVVLFDMDGQEIREEPLRRSPAEPNVFRAHVEGASVGSLYKFKLDGELLGDPYARCLPFGPRGPGRVVEPILPRVHPKRGVHLAHGEVIYELHIGTFTDEGTFTSARTRLPYLRDLGVTVLELMPIAAFPGERGWGYDGVGLFAPFIGYGALSELVEFVDAAHGHGLSVILDVVYNHLGPDGNLLPAYSDLYFHPERKNPWGAAPAFEGVPFRRLMIESARHWLEDVGFDGLRIDAAHELEPGGEPHILREIADIAASVSPAAVIIAEDDRNDPVTLAGHGIHALWSDDFHHSVHVQLTGERDGYYAAYQGTLEELATIINRNHLYEGQVFAPSGAERGKPASGVERHRFVYALQNHDQVGNRALGERLVQLTSIEQVRAATVLLLFLPATPLIFMGEEWGATSPFLYFTDHAEPLGTEITKGRRAEFAHFAAFAEKADQVPDPQAQETFLRCKLRWDEREQAGHSELLALHRSALRLRREDVVLQRSAVHAAVRHGLLWVERRSAEGARVLLWNAGPTAVALPQVAHAWRRLLSSAANADDDSSLAPRSAAIFAVL